MALKPTIDRNSEIFSPQTCDTINAKTNRINDSIGRLKVPPLDYKEPVGELGFSLLKKEWDRTDKWTYKPDPENPNGTTYYYKDVTKVIFDTPTNYSLQIGRLRFINLEIPIKSVKRVRYSNTIGDYDWAYSEVEKYDYTDYNSFTLLGKVTKSVGNEMLFGTFDSNDSLMMYRMPSDSFDLYVTGRMQAKTLRVFTYYII